MKLGLETMIGMLFLLTGILFSFSVYHAGVKASDAKQYPAWVMERLEGAKYAKVVKEACIEEAREQGYRLILQEETEDERRIEKVSLCYSVELPFLEEEQQYQVSGYSHIEGR